MSREAATKAVFRWLNYAEAAQYLGVSERQLRRWVPMGVVPHTKYSNRVLFTYDQLDEFIKRSSFTPGE